MGGKGHRVRSKASARSGASGPGFRPARCAVASVADTASQADAWPKISPRFSSSGLHVSASDGSADIVMSSNICAGPSCESPKRRARSPPEILEEDATTCASSGCSTPREELAPKKISQEAAFTADQDDSMDVCQEEKVPTSSTSSSLESDDSPTPLCAEDAKSRREGLVSRLAHIISTLAATGNRPHRTTSFHAVQVPTLSLDAYLKRLSAYFFCSDECFVLALMYIDKVLKQRPDFVVNPLNVHRVVLASVVCAAKFNDDSFYSNKHYAHVGGLKLQELNKLEAQFLTLTQYRLHVKNEEDYEIYRHMLEPHRAPETAWSVVPPSS